jgi:hypothetical protein
MAKQFPRDHIVARNNVLVMCDNFNLAKDATYAYARGGTNISGASIDLLVAIAARWGNLDYGFKVLATRPTEGDRIGESDVMVWAHDIETNVTRTMEFSVKHLRDKNEDKGGSKPLTSERDIYEAVANQASRRMRRCLEDIIPRDLVDDAVKQCKKTLESKIKVTPETIKTLIESFAGINVTQAQLEKYIQRKMSAIEPATYIRLKEIGKSIKEGVAMVSDFFDALNVVPQEAPKEPVDADFVVEKADEQPAAQPAEKVTEEQGFGE